MLNLVEGEEVAAHAVRVRVPHPLDVLRGLRLRVLQRKVPTVQQQKGLVGEIVFDSPHKQCCRFNLLNHFEKRGCNQSSQSLCRNKVSTQFFAKMRNHVAWRGGG